MGTKSKEDTGKRGPGKTILAIALAVADIILLLVILGGING